MDLWDDCEKDKVVKMQRKNKNSILELVEGDITEMETDAIVNAAGCRACG